MNNLGEDLFLLELLEDQNGEDHGEHGGRDSQGLLGVGVGHSLVHLLTELGVGLKIKKGKFETEASAKDGPKQGKPRSPKGTRKEE